MANDTNQPLTAGEKQLVEKKETATQRGIFSRIWNGLFRIRGEDFEKRLKHLSKEEAAVLARMKKRSQSWRRMARNVIIFSIILEVFAVGYAIMSTRSLDLNWKMRALHVLPMFVLPGLSSVVYSTVMSFTRMCDRKDQKTLERLRAERQAKIDELKERTNYYITQQLIQRYDPDPAAKAAAATVLASKLGADSGLRVYVGDESTKLNPPSGQSNDVEFVQSKGLRNRKQQPLSRSNSVGSVTMRQSIEEMPHDIGPADAATPTDESVVVEHHPKSMLQDGGWIARIAALLVGEDPTQSYALICGNCHMHNGLARKEDFPYITYYCPHCRALNRSEQLEDPASSSSINTSCPTRTNNGNGKSSIDHDKILSGDLTASAEMAAVDLNEASPVSN